MGKLFSARMREIGDLIPVMSPALDDLSEIALQPNFATIGDSRIENNITYCAANVINYFYKRVDKRLEMCQTDNTCLSVILSFSTYSPPSQSKPSGATFLGGCKSLSFCKYFKRWNMRKSACCP